MDWSNGRVGRNLSRHKQYSNLVRRCSLDCKDAELNIRKLYGAIYRFYTRQFHLWLTPSWLQSRPGECYRSHPSRGRVDIQWHGLGHPRRKLELSDVYFDRERRCDNFSAVAHSKQGVSRCVQELCLPHWRTGIRVRNFRICCGAGGPAVSIHNAQNPRYFNKFFKCQSQVILGKKGLLE